MITFERLDQSQHVARQFSSHMKTELLNAVATSPRTWFPSPHPSAHNCDDARKQPFQPLSNPLPYKSQNCDTMACATRTENKTPLFPWLHWGGGATKVPNYSSSGRPRCVGNSSVFANRGVSRGPAVEARQRHSFQLFHRTVSHQIKLRAARGWVSKRKIALENYSSQVYKRVRAQCQRPKPAAKWSEKMPRRSPAVGWFSETSSSDPSALSSFWLMSFVLAHDCGWEIVIIVCLPVKMEEERGFLFCSWFTSGLTT
jgi:hypothetical protein